jgi:large subunit ribosomal protein L4
MGILWERAMPQIAIVNLKNEKVDEVSLPESVFEVPRRDHLLHDVILSFLANRRAGTSSTKNRSAVSGGGKKPWRQKGTGRARAGSIRSPLWVGGGTIFGPTPRSYAYHVSKKVRSYALRSALSEKVRANRLLVIDAMEFEKPSTKGFMAVLSALKVQGDTLLAMKAPSQTVLKSACNIPGVKVVPVERLNVFDICRYDTLILTRDAIGFWGESREK